MFPLIAGSGALSALMSLLQSSTANVSGSSGSDPLLALEQSLTGAESSAGQTLASSTSTGSASSAFQLDPGMMSALLSLQGQVGGTNGQESLFSQLDANGDGTISKSEFENALSADGVDTSSADALFNKLDSNGDGSISQSEISSAKHGHGHHHHVGGGGGSGQGGASSLMNATNADGSTTQTTTNSDGSTTTTITYADGSTVNMTTPAAAQNGGSSGSGSGTPNQSNLIEQLIQMQSQFLAQSAPGLSTLA